MAAKAATMAKIAAKVPRIPTLVFLTGLFPISSDASHFSEITLATLRADRVPFVSLVISDTCSNRPSIRLNHSAICNISGHGRSYCWCGNCS
jgi:hypothetical protein